MNTVFTKRIFLICGILAALLYVGSDIVAGLSWDGYSFVSQAVSELRGIGAPTRVYLVPTLFVYAVLEIVFGFGIWKVSKKRSLHITGALFIGLGILDLMGPFFAMNASEPVGSITNMIHISVTILTLLSIILILGFGALSAGRKFFIYSMATLLIIIIAGVLTFLEVPRIAAGLATPWMGVKERVNIYSYMLWIATLAVTLLRVSEKRKLQ